MAKEAIVSDAMAKKFATGKDTTLFAEALAKHGFKPRMEENYQAELADLPPKAA